MIGGDQGFELLLAAISGGLLLQVVQVARKWMAVRREDERERKTWSWPHAMRAIHEVRRELDAILAVYPEATRAVVLVAYPYPPAGRCYSSVLYDAQRYGASDARAGWQRV